MRKLYVLSTTDADGYKMYKIGFTKQSVESRVKQLQTGNYSEINIEYVFEADGHIVKIESRLHRDFSDRRISGEWFELESTEFDNIPILCNRYYNMFKSLESNTYLQDRGVL